MVRDLALEVSASIGIALAPGHGEESAILLQRADVAMYSAKARQKGVEVYAPERDQYSPQRLALVGELRRALEGRQLEVYYQPKAELATGRVVGAEALLRWDHPERGFVPPDEFVGLAEHTGLIHPLALFVLEDALRRCAAWRRAGTPVGVAVNLSARNLVEVSLPDEVGTLLLETGVHAGSLTLEITESSLMGDAGRTLEVLDRLHAMGIQLSIDDFGTGYSSLSYLRRLPVTEVKIDKSFVLAMTSNTSDEAIVRSTVDLGHNLGLRVVAEGVEDVVTWERLVALGCDVAQGYLLSRPIPASQFERWLAERMAGSGRPADAQPVAERRTAAPAR
jgi:EAL domain-containing protein (putative c-di-GMP-specific phosphodiesterase class I)